jgi:hypothetical protein
VLTAMMPKGVEHVFYAGLDGLAKNMC